MPYFSEKKPIIFMSNLIRIFNKIFVELKIFSKIKYKSGIILKGLMLCSELIV